MAIMHLNFVKNRLIRPFFGLSIIALFGCGPPPKTESIIAYEAFMRAVYSNDMKAVLDRVTPSSRKRLRQNLQIEGSNAEDVAARMTVVLGWEFERITGRLTKVEPNRSNASRHVLTADIGGSSGIL